MKPMRCIYSILKDWKKFFQNEHKYFEKACCCHWQIVKGTFYLRTILFQRFHLWNLEKMHAEIYETSILGSIYNKARTSLLKKYMNKGKD